MKKNFQAEKVKFSDKQITSSQRKMNEERYVLRK